MFSRAVRPLRNTKSCRRVAGNARHTTGRRSFARRPPVDPSPSPEFNLEFFDQLAKTNPKVADFVRRGGEVTEKDLQGLVDSMSPTELKSIMNSPVFEGLMKTGVGGKNDPGMNDSMLKEMINKFDGQGNFKKPGDNSTPGQPGATPEKVDSEYMGGRRMWGEAEGENPIREFPEGEEEGESSGIDYDLNYQDEHDETTKPPSTVFKQRAQIVGKEISDQRDSTRNIVDTMMNEKKEEEGGRKKFKKEDLTELKRFRIGAVAMPKELINRTVETLKDSRMIVPNNWNSL